jgi:hypothetical protein
VTGLIGNADGSVGGIRTSTGDQRADVVVLTVGIPELRTILDQTTRVRGVLPIRYRLKLVRAAPVPRVTVASLDPGRAPDAYETVLHRQSAVVRRHDVRSDGTVSLTILSFDRTPPPSLASGGRAEISQPSFASGPSLRSVGQLRLLPHIHGQVPGLMVAGPSTHLAGLLSTELLSAAIAAETLGRADH